MKNSSSLEQRVKVRARRGAIQSALLLTLFGVGVVTIAAAAPNVLQLLKYTNPDWIAPRNPNQRLRETLNRMKKKGLVRFVRRGNNMFPVLTTNGEKEAERVRIGHKGIPVPRRWDGRWRIVAFDIPEGRKRQRVLVRQFLMTLGFMRLQDSMWVHPYDCEEIIKLIKTDLRVGHDLIYIIADAIENDRHIRGFFDLPLR